MSLVHDRDGWVSGGWLAGGGRPGGGPPGGSPDGAAAATELFRYVYLPREPVLESPRPYFHPVRTLGGDLVSLYRPHDHVWHKGIAWSLCNVGPENFWGGPTYTRDGGYRQLDNNGRMRHDAFTALEVRDHALHIGERLSWVTQQGTTLIAERRRIRVSVLPGEARGGLGGSSPRGEPSAWRLSFAAAMRNVSGHLVMIGSPTTEGRPNAGYSGLFWRGPRSFSGGTVLTPDGPGGDELMGWRGPWLGYTGRHDGHGRASTLVFCDRPANFSAPSRWFVRTGMYACVCPAPFFSEEFGLEPGQTLELGYDVLIADGALDVAGCRELAGQAGAGAPR
jgi:Methane oxygenase PmoA